MAQYSCVLKNIDKKADGKSYIYITEDKKINKLQLIITNTSGASIALKGGAPIPESQNIGDPSNFYIYRPKSILTAAEFKNIKISLTGWTAKHYSDDDGSDIWGLFPSNNTSLESGDSLTFAVNDVQASGSPAQQNLSIDNVISKLEANTYTPHVTLLNLPGPGDKLLTDTVAFAIQNSGNVLITPEGYKKNIENIITFTIRNTSQSTPIAANATTGKKSEFNIMFVPAVNGGVDMQGALATETEMQNFTPSISESNGNKWTKKAYLDTQTPTFTFSPKDGETEVLGVESKAIIVLDIGSIVTTFPQGVTSMYILYSNIPGYNDGTTSLVVNKIPYLYIDTFSSSPTQPNYEQDKVTLAWSIKPDDEHVSTNLNRNACKNTDSSIIYPTCYSGETLTATGYGQSVTSTINIFPFLKGGWIHCSPPDGSTPWFTLGRPVLLTFKDQLWFLCGGTGNENNPVFRTPDCRNWTIVKGDAAFGARDNSAGCVFAVQALHDSGGTELMWVMGGIVPDNPPAGATKSKNDIWNSADGNTWTEVTTIGIIWSARSEFSCLTFGGKIWVIGGVDGSGNLLNDVWSSSDGVAWTEVTSGEPSSGRWTPRKGLSACVFKGNIYIAGGVKTDGTLCNDMWYSSDGKVWNGVNTNTALYTSSYNLNMQSTEDYLYIMGGIDIDSSGNPQGISQNVQIAYSGGNYSVTTLSSPSWGSVINTASAVYCGGIVVAGGTRGGSVNYQIDAFGSTPTS